MEANVHNQKEGKEKQVKLSSSFGKKISDKALRQVVVSQASNQRQGSAHSKDRSEVRGGGRKPWRQKGTGRARHGSRRSPIWKGGGATFGPRNERNYKKTIPAKLRKRALGAALADKAAAGDLALINELKWVKISAKEMVDFLKTLSLKKGSTLIALSDNDKKAYLSVRNLENVSMKKAADLTALDVSKHKNLVIEKSAFIALEKQIKTEK